MYYDFWRLAFFILLLLNSVFLAIIIAIIWKPVREMREAATKLDNATERVQKAGEVLEVVKEYNQHAATQIEQTKNAIERVPVQAAQEATKIVQQLMQSNPSIPPT